MARSTSCRRPRARALTQDWPEGCRALSNRCDWPADCFFWAAAAGSQAEGKAEHVMLSSGMWATSCLLARGPVCPPHTLGPAELERVKHRAPGTLMPAPHPIHSALASRGPQQRQRVGRNSSSQTGTAPALPRQWVDAHMTLLLGVTMPAGIGRERASPLPPHLAKPRRSKVRGSMLLRCSQCTPCIPVLPVTHSHPSCSQGLGDAELARASEHLLGHPCHGSRREGVWCLEKRRRRWQAAPCLGTAGSTCQAQTAPGLRVLGLQAAGGHQGGT